MHLHPAFKLSRKMFVQFASAVALATLASQVALAATPAELLADYEAQAKTAGSPVRGERLFTTNFGRELGFSCSSCHGKVPVKTGRDQVTEKPIAPLAPAANPARFTDKSKVEYAFRLNCRDVVGRECTAGEKADVMSWLITLKP